MPKPKTKLLFFLLLLVLSLLLAGCASESKPPEADSLPALELQGLEETRTFTLSEIKAMPAIEGWGGTVSSAGVITPPQRLKGVPLLELAALAGGLQPGMGVSILAKDGYGMTMSYEQIAEGSFITYDPGTGAENEAEGPLQVIIAYERDGEPIPPEEDGPLRLFIISTKNDNVVDGHWSVKWVTQIRLKPMSEEWSLSLEGSRTELMDRNSFESCSAPGCHQAAWTDEAGNEWQGVPLYYLAGRVDGGNIHEDRAYNDLFARAGYVLQIFAADGSSVSIDSSRTIFNRDLFLASSVNGEALGEGDFPLRLVGEGLDEAERLSQVAQIVLDPNEGVELPPEEAETAAPGAMTLPEGAVLKIFGKVLNLLTLKPENLQGMGPIEAVLEHPSKGEQTYRGVPLNTLLSLAGPQEEAATLVFTASDGFAAEASLSEVQACADCLVAINEDGTLNLVMPGMPSTLWVKTVNFIEVK